MTRYTVKRNYLLRRYSRNSQCPVGQLNFVCFLVDIATLTNGAVTVLMVVMK